MEVEKSLFSLKSSLSMDKNESVPTIWMFLAVIISSYFTIRKPKKWFDIFFFSVRVFTNCNSYKGQDDAPVTLVLLRNFPEVLEVFWTELGITSSSIEILRKLLRRNSKTFLHNSPTYFQLFWEVNLSFFCQIFNHKTSLAKHLIVLYQ